MDAATAAAAATEATGAGTIDHPSPESSSHSPATPDHQLSPQHHSPPPAYDEATTCQPADPSLEPPVTEDMHFFKSDPSPPEDITKQSIPNGDPLSTVQEEDPAPEEKTFTHLPPKQTKLFQEPFMRRINFIDESDNFEKLADFMVVPEGSTPGEISDKMFDEWGLARPNLILSIIGWSSQTPTILPRQHARFKEGLLRMVQATNTWIVSSGITQGVDVLIAEVLQDAQYLEWIGQDEPQLHLIGLANWNGIRHGDEIQFWCSTSQDETATQPFPYNVNSGTDDGLPTLNKLYSHFLLFDSSTAASCELRSCLECLLSTNKDPSVPSEHQHHDATDDPHSAEPQVSNSGTMISLHPRDLSWEGPTIPTCLIVIGGELMVFEQVAKSLVNHIAVVICEGVGGASDIICKALRFGRRNRKNLTPNQESNIQNLIRNLAKKLNVEYDEHNQTDLEFIKIIVEYSRYVVTYRIDRPNNQIDECILKALIRGVADSGYDPLQLAMTVHQCDDIVQHIVESESDINNRKNIDETIFRSLIEGQLPFVKLFLEVGFEMKRYLTPNRLSQLYQHAIENFGPLQKLLEKTVGPKEQYSLSDVYFMIYYFTLSSPQITLVSLPDSSNKGFEDPFRELCFWSALSFQPDLTKYFWSKAKNPLIISLMMCKLWQEIANCLTLDELELNEEIEPLKEEYQNLVLSCLEEYQGCNTDLAHLVLMYRNPTFGLIDCIDVAGFTDNKDFIATSDAQIIIENKWKSGMRCSAKGIIVALLFPFTIPAIYSQQIELDINEDSNANGLTLEEEILLLEEQNQQKHRIIKQEQARKENREAMMAAARGRPYDPDAAAAAAAKKKNKEKKMDGGDPDAIPLVDFKGVNGATEDRPWDSPPQEVPANDLDLEMLDDTTGVSLRKTTYSQFYQAPVTKFFLHITMYFVFLMIYTYFYFYELRAGEANRWSVTILLYMVSYVIEIIWHFCQGDISFKVKLVIWCSSEWNVLDVTYLSMGITAFVLLMSEDPWCHMFSRALYGVTSILMWIRLLRFYLASEKLGSMWIMIRRMLWETLIFMTHMGIMIFASGISLFCINHRRVNSAEEYRNQTMGLDKCPQEHSFYKYEFYHKPHMMFLKPFFMFNGELFLSHLRCGDHGVIAWVMAALFLLLGNALMLNLLVAIYAAIFNDVQANSEREWKMEMYWLLKDFEEKTILPPPLSLIETVIQLSRIICRKYHQTNGRRRRGQKSLELQQDEEAMPDEAIKKMQIFETYCVGKAMRTIASEKSSFDSVVDMIHDTETQMGKVQDCKSMVNNVRRMIQQQKNRRRKKKNKTAASTEKLDS